MLYELVVWGERGESGMGGKERMGGGWGGGRVVWGKREDGRRVGGERVVHRKTVTVVHTPWRNTKFDYNGCQNCLCKLIVCVWSRLPFIYLEL